MLRFSFIVTAYLLRFGKVFYCKKAIINHAYSGILLLHQHIFQMFLANLNNIIKYCRPQSLHIFEQVFSISVCFKLHLEGQHTFFLKDSNVMRTPGSHMAILSNQTLTYELPFGQLVVLFILFYFILYFIYDAVEYANVTCLHL